MLKNKIIGKKIRNIVILLMSIIIIIGTYKYIDNSRAEKVVKIETVISDSYGYLADENIILEAKQIEDGLYEVKLPESVNTKKNNKITKIMVGNIEYSELKNIETKVEDVFKTENAIEENKIYLTKEQIEQQLSLQVEYDVAILNKNKDGKYSKTLLSEKSEEERKQIPETAEKLYSKILRYEDKENGKLVEVKGYLPVDAELQIKEVTQEKLTQIFGEKKIKVAYDIKILGKVITEIPGDEANPDKEPEKIIETIEINPEDFGEKCEVTITDASIAEKSQVYHVKKDNTYEQVNVKENTEGNISFEAQSFSVYAVGDDVIDPDPGEDVGLSYQTRFDWRTSDGKTGSCAALTDAYPTITVPYGGTVRITNNTYGSDALCVTNAGDNCVQNHDSSHTLSAGSYTVNGAKGYNDHTGGTYTIHLTVKEIPPPQISVNTTSCGWRNSNLSLTISIYSSTGLASGNSYQYFLSNSATALSGGSWKNYTNGTAFNINPGTTGTYYLFVKRVSDTSGAISISNGTNTTVSSTVYHRYGPYLFDYTPPTAGTISTSKVYTNQPNVTVYVTAPSDAHSGVNYVNINGWYGTGWVSTHKGIRATYDSANNRYYATHTFAEMPNTSTGAINQGEGLYAIDAHVADRAGNDSNPGRVQVIYDTTAPTISVDTQACTWRKTPLNVTITAQDPISNGSNSGLSSSNSYQYFLSNSPTALSGGSWQNYTSGTAITLNPPTSGTYYLFVKRVNDNAGNTSTANGTATTIGGTAYQRFGAYQFDYDNPIISVSPSSCTWRNSAISTTITASDTNGSGLAPSNSYQYYLSNSATELLGGEWKDYTSGTAISLNPAVSGTYYLFVKRVKDNVGNISTENGTVTTIGETTYQRFDTYQFDYEKPIWSIENLAIDRENDSLTVDIVGTDELSGIAESLLSAENITIYVDGVKANSIQKTLGNATTTANGIKHQLILSNLEEDKRQIGKEYKEWSGNITLVIAAETLRDNAGNKSSEQNLSLGHVDTVNPDFKYVYSSSDIDKTLKTVTVVFSVNDKFFSESTLKVEDLTIMFDGLEPDWTKTTREFTNVKDITTIINGENKVIGKEYTLVLSNLEQKKIEDGDNYLNYSGVLTLLIPAGKISDTSGNTNNAQTITIGISIEDTIIKDNPSNIFDLDGTDPDGLHIGDFVNYDAGTWTQEEINAIKTGLKTSPVTANGSTELPSDNYQFGGFAAGSSRNESVAPGEDSYDYIKDKATGNALSGWRVFDIDDDGAVTLISAGNPEAAYINWQEAFQFEYILTGKVNENWKDAFEIDTDPNNYVPRANYNVYVNEAQQAQSATPLTISRLNEWYSKYIGATENLFNDTEIFKKIYQTPYIKYQNIIDNYSYYWLCEAHDQFANFSTDAETREISTNCYVPYGIRMLVKISPSVVLEKNGTKTVTGGNTTNYGGDQTYNVWDIKKPETAKPSDIFDMDGTNPDGLHIGDFINYDAGTWTQGEINAIQTGEKSNPVKANGSTDHPNTAFQFGGFTEGSSRNGNATPLVAEWGNYEYVKDKSTGEAITGWRVFDVDGDKVTLISAGNPEDYYHPLETNAGYISEYILTGNVNNSWPEGQTESANYQKRDWSNYINKSQKAESAMLLTKNRLDDWYTKYTNTANADTSEQSTFQKIYQEPYTKYQNMIDNYSYYWLSVDDKTGYGICDMDPNVRYSWSNANYAFGVRVLVTLSSDVLLERTENKTTVTGGNTTTYGGDQTYNVWKIYQEDITTGDGAVIVDVVDPVWELEKITASAIDPDNKISSVATITFKGVDKYWNTSTLTNDNINNAIKVIVNGTEVTSGITKTLTSTKELTEQRIVDGKTTTVKYGEEYAITIKGFSQKANQVKIRIPKGVLIDQSGNDSEETEFIVCNVLKREPNLSEQQTKAFLGESVETTLYPPNQTSVTPIMRQDIEKIVFVNDISAYDFSNIQRAWDVSAQEDASIVAITTNTTAPYTIYIVSQYEIYANPYSRGLFAYIGYASTCKDTETITNLSLLNTSNVTNMYGMFYYCGYTAMTSLDLGEKFDTSNVTDMGFMFSNCGYGAMTTLNLGTNFDTSNVTSMRAMFQVCGYTKMLSLSLGDKFDTSKVTNMGYMFYYCGYTAMTSLDLGDKFDTSNVTDMDYMFYDCGAESMTVLDLGPLFTRIAYQHNNFMTGCGTSNIVIYAPETIYLNKTTFKLNKIAR